MPTARRAPSGLNAKEVTWGDGYESRKLSSSLATSQFSRSSVTIRSPGRLEDHPVSARREGLEDLLAVPVPDDDGLVLPEDGDDSAGPEPSRIAAHERVEFMTRPT